MTLQELLLKKLVTLCALNKRADDVIAEGERRIAELESELARRRSATCPNADLDPSADENTSFFLRRERGGS